MIAKSTSISYGSNELRYITGESANKKQPEKIFHVMNNIIPDWLDASSIWLDMKARLSKYKPITNTLIRIELSPAIEHTKGFTIEDWKKLWKDFVEEYDKQEITDNKNKIISKKTNLANTRGTVWVHYESDSGIPHIHAAYCRIDENTHMNNDHVSHLRAQRAAEAVAKKRGWTTAAEIRKIRILEVAKDCNSILKNMNEWSWGLYKTELENKGYDFRPKRDSKGMITGYVLRKGNAKYKASELGSGRKLMASKIENTWATYHTAPIEPKRIDNSAPRTNSPRPIYNPATYFEGYKPNTELYKLVHNDEEKRYYLPNEVHDILNEEFDYRNIVNWREMQDMAVTIFLQLSLPQDISTGSGGGGSHSDLPWRDKDEDDEHWMRRCALTASRFIKKKPKIKLHR